MGMNGVPEMKGPACVTFMTEEGKLAVWHNLRHDVDAARMMAQGLTVVLAPKEAQQIIQPPPGLVMPHDNLARPRWGRDHEDHE